ncbi:MAG TPA: hypothetical protein DIW64_17900 [Cellvibrio sp.]|nr:hypothetical protein [Cellvibrio sp.]
MTSRKFFALFIGCALVPLVAAKASLEMGLFSQTSVNKGEWLEHEIQLLPAASPMAPHWRLVYVRTSNCNHECDQALHAMQQLYTGLGRKQLNIEPLFLSAKAVPELNQFPAINALVDTQPQIELDNQIVIVNQRGLVLLRYPVSGDGEQMKNVAKDIRTDLLRLMNYDRNGV